jgi:hypothetical protein
MNMPTPIQNIDNSYYRETRGLPLAGSKPVSLKPAHLQHLADRESLASNYSKAGERGFWLVHCATPGTLGD